MSMFFKLYLVAWSLACMLALLLFLRRPAGFVICSRKYWRFLGARWKLLTFAAGAGLITGVAPYTGDPTWDYVDGAFMSVLCFVTAPWAVGVLYLRTQGRVTWTETYVAVCAWLFSASWSYDLYLLLRDGFYPATWHANLLASSVIYLSAGLFWNLEWQAGRGVVFGFLMPDWPAAPHASWRIALYAAIFAVPAIAAVLVFMW